MDISAQRGGVPLKYIGMEGSQNSCNMMHALVAFGGLWTRQ